jgi:Type IV secretion system pilin
MKKIVEKILLGLLFVPVLALGATVATTDVSAVCNTTNLSIASGANCAQGNDQPADLFGGDNSIFRRVTNILLFLVGAISVIMLIIGGIRYVISGGDQNQVTSAKNTILYAIVGIVVAFLAYAAVNFVTQALIGGTTTSP